MRTTTLAALTALAGCGGFGHVNQGQVVDYQRAEGLITLVSDSNYQDPAHPRYDVLPAVTIRTPADPQEMGPAPEAGKLLSLDCANRGAVFFDSSTQSLRTVPCTLVSERAGVSATDARVTSARFPLVDPKTGTMTAYAARERKLIEFSVPEEYRRLPVETWKFGDEIRYYYKDGGRALRLMNVTRTDLNKGGK